MAKSTVSRKPTLVQLRYLRRGLGQAGGKLPLFDEDGQPFSAQTIKACIDHGWACPWFKNPIKPDWLVCKLTPKGRQLALVPTSQKPERERS